MTELLETGAATGWYVYGVVAADAPPLALGDACGVDATRPVVLLAEAGLAAIASGVSLDEFGAAALEANLRDEVWLGEKVCAHQEVLESALSRTALVPFRFGTIYSSDGHVRRMLRENASLAGLLERLAGTVELGVKAYVDPEAFAWTHTAEPQPDDGGGRAYLLRKQRERWLAECRGRFGAECAQASHERLAAAAEDGRANPPRATDDGEEMVLNGAYLVRGERRDAFEAELAALAAAFARDGVRFELTGPWPPYNFVDQATGG